MPPSQDKRDWRSLPVATIGCVVCAVLVTRLGLGPGGALLSIAIALGLLMYYVQHERPGEREERERFARERGLPYPQPPRRRLFSR